MVGLHLLSHSDIDQWEERWLISFTDEKKVYETLAPILSVALDSYEQDKLVLFLKGTRDQLDEVRSFMNQHGDFLEG